MGITQAITPYKRSARVWKKKILYSFIVGAFTTDDPDIFNLNCIVLRAQALVILAGNSRRFAAGAHLAGKHFSTYIEPSSDHASKKSHKHAKEGNSRLLVSDGDVRLALSLHQIRYFKPISAVTYFCEKKTSKSQKQGI